MLSFKRSVICRGGGGGGGGRGNGKSQFYGTVSHKGETTLYHVSFPISYAQKPGNMPTLYHV